jgi:hypothetical protein
MSRRRECATGINQHLKFERVVNVDNIHVDQIQQRPDGTIIDTGLRWLRKVAEAQTYENSSWHKSKQPLNIND